MKKSLSMLLVGSMLVTALAGCGGNTDTQGAGELATGRITRMLQQPRF